MTETPVILCKSGQLPSLLDATATATETVLPEKCSCRTSRRKGRNSLIGRQILQPIVAVARNNGSDCALVKDVFFQRQQAYVTQSVTTSMIVVASGRQGKVRGELP